LWRGRELLTNPHLPEGVFRPPGEEWGAYETRPVFGYDDCWPSLDPSPWPGRDQLVRDHGELCWQKWAIAAAPEALTCSAVSPDASWTFSRCSSVRHGALQIDFACRNTGSRPLLVNWAGHALVPPAAVQGLELPECRHITVDHAPGSVGPDVSPRQAGDIWACLSACPAGQAVMLVLHDTSSSRLSIALDGARWEWFLGGVPRPALGLWYNRRGYPREGRLARDEFGVEWMLAGPTRLEDAVNQGSAIKVLPGETYCWSLQWRISALPACLSEG
jgi:hypothetical protein